MLYHTLYPAHYKLGAAPLLEFDTIPESDKAIQVIKDWVRDSIYHLSPWSDQEYFLTNVAELIALAYAFDRAEAQQYIPRARCIADRKQRLRELIRGADQERYIVHDLIEVIDGSSETAISAGVLFVQYAFLADYQ